MPIMTIKNVPGDLYEKLKKCAQEHGRSINNEVIAYLFIAGEYTSQARRVIKKDSVPLITPDSRILSEFPSTALSPGDFAQ